MYLTRENLHVFYHQVHQIVAKKLGIEDFELKSASELVDEIEKANPNVSSRVREFIKAYEQWFNVHQKIDEAGSSGNLSTQENQQLTAAMDARDTTRKELISELDKL